MALCLQSYQWLYQVCTDKDILDFVTHEEVTKLGTGEQINGEMEIWKCVQSSRGQA